MLAKKMKAEAREIMIAMVNISTEIDDYSVAMKR